MKPASGRLFSESHAATSPSGVHIANIDGASRGNPGPAAYAVVMRDPQGHVILELGKKLGRETNNVAEYYALLAALDYAVTHGISALRLRSDSELLVRQMQGRYKVKSADLKPLHERASKFCRQLSYCAIEHVRREQNREADALANVALDSGSISSGAAPSAKTVRSGTSELGPARGPLRIRARFANGVFVPAEPIELAEGSDVLLEVKIAKNL